MSALGCVVPKQGTASLLIAALWLLVLSFWLTVWDSRRQKSTFASHHHHQRFLIGKMRVEKSDKHTHQDFYYPFLLLVTSSSLASVDFLQSMMKFFRFHSAPRRITYDGEMCSFRRCWRFVCATTRAPFKRFSFCKFLEMFLEEFPAMAWVEHEDNTESNNMLRA